MTTDSTHNWIQNNTARIRMHTIMYMYSFMCISTSVSRACIPSMIHKYERTHKRRETSTLCWKIAYHPLQSTSKVNSSDFEGLRCRAIRVPAPDHRGPQAPLDAAPPLARELEARVAVAGKDLWTQWTGSIQAESLQNTGAGNVFSAGNAGGLLASVLAINSLGLFTGRFVSL